MLTARRASMTPVFLAAMTLVAVPAFSQVDLTGVWGARYQEDQPERPFLTVGGDEHDRPREVGVEQARGCDQQLALK